MIPRTLKNQILLFLIPAIIILFILFGVIMYWASHHNILDHAKFDLLRLATQYETKAGSINLDDSLSVGYLKKLQKAYSNGPFELVAVFGQNNTERIIFTDGALPVFDLENKRKSQYIFGEKKSSSGNEHFLYLIYPIQGHWFIWRESLSFVDHGLNEFRTILFTIIPLGCLFISLILYWIIAVKTKEFSQIIKTVQTISAGSIQRRLPEGNKQTEIGELVHSLNQMLSRLQEGYDNINSFSANIAHELRTPLTIIGGEIELALRNAHTQEEKKLFENILEEVRYLTRVIKQMLLLSKLERGLVELEQYEINLTEIVNRAVKRFESLSKQKNVKFTVMTTCKRSVFGDPTLVEEVYNIVLHNAIKYSTGGSEIIINLLCESDACHTQIKDNCGGLSADQCANIFNPANKIKPRDSRDGTGIGLSIAYKIMELHGGEIFVNSDAETGCTFHIKFPLAIYE